VEGNTITPLENGDQIFPAMLSGIRSAQRTITFENFLFQEGEISNAFAQALAERARAGVKVHFLQDALNSCPPFLPQYANSIESLIPNSRLIVLRNPEISMTQNMVNGYAGVHG
jgi:phosphatidylserine/phosphatidylglycerophosphate/cardiolipin synthase-like enzyme